MRKNGLLLRGTNYLQPVGRIVPFGVGHEGAHRHRIVTQHALLALGRESSLGAQGQAVVNALG